MTFCPKCHAGVKEDQTFCESCGAPLKEGAARQEAFSVTADLARAKHQKQIKEARIAIIVGLLFIGLYFWAKQNPFGASLTALIIYLTNLVVAAAIEPETIPQGIILKVIIIIVLGRGVQTGLAYRKLVNQPTP